MKEILILGICLILPFGISAKDVDVIKQESKEFQTMKQCISWLDKNYPNYQWHKPRGMAWNLWIDSPQEVQGATFMENKNNKKLTHPVSISCVYTETGTRGVFFKGSYYVMRAQ
ncbi:hypothetical protein [Acinetobacter gerneri]|uniref:hypothetical protein n=1 Tax=Acinetobacter gerneri TaxID=202952 RepID=UPI0028AA1107|nr:hypothetical protein [Acinetobacter gerneri]